MQKRYQTLQSLQDNKKKYFKDAGDCDEEMRMLHEENEERQARFQKLSETWCISQKEAEILEDEIQALQAGEETRGSCASQSNGCCTNPAIVEQHRLCSSSPLPFRPK